MYFESTEMNIGFCLTYTESSHRLWREVLRKARLSPDNSEKLLLYKDNTDVFRHTHPTAGSVAISLN